MPLSEQEQRLLEEMERSLYRNDADFVSAASSRRGRPTYSAIVVGVLVSIVGIGLLIAGVAVRLPLVGVIGFIVMFTGVLIAATPSRKAASTEARPGFMQNLSDRWEKRQDEQDE